MMHHVLRNAVLLSLAATVAAATPAQAQDKPFKISGAGVAPEGLPAPCAPPFSCGLPHWAIGEATHLGRYYGQGLIATTSLNPVVDQGAVVGFEGEFGSAAPFVFTAANGDDLVAEYGRTDFGATTPGTFTLTIIGVQDDAPIVVGHFVAQFVVQPSLSTGRFAGVTGSWEMIADTEPFVLGSSDPAGYTWEGAGTLTFPRR